jgi:hypothetical protein
MRRLFLSVFGVFAVVGVAAAQQPQTQQPPIAAPAYPPAAMAAAPVQSGSGLALNNGGCINCSGPATFPSLTGGAPAAGFQMVTGGHCMLGYGCQNGCGSVKSDLAFQFGTCKQFFSPCGPSCAGGLFGGGKTSLFGNKEKCPVVPFAQPYGTGWLCPRQYDTYANH